jgi:nitrite reductase/ring-hydroxylating ferredoxin subunit
LGLGAVGAGGLLGAHLTYRQAAGVDHADWVPDVVGPGWHDVGPLADLADGQLERREVASQPLVVLRRGDSAYVLSGVCSHLAGPLAEGELVDGGRGPCVRCPWHGSTFRLADGSVVRGPATAPQPSFAVDVSGGLLRVRLPAAG